MCSLQHSPSALDTCNAAELSSPQAGRLTSTGSLIRPMTLAGTKETLPIAFLVRHGQAWQHNDRPGPLAQRHNAPRSARILRPHVTSSLRPQTVTPAPPASAVFGCLCPITAAAPALRPVHDAGLGLALTLGTECLLFSWGLSSISYRTELLTLHFSIMQIHTHRCSTAPA
jgi:hypothetical protein